MTTPAPGTPPENGTARSRATAGAAKLPEALQSLIQLRDQLCATLIERETEVNLALVALVARQHLFMLGPPGVAKSMIARLVGGSLGGSFFELLLTRFTEPAEVFGPISIKALVEQELYERRVDRYLPSVRVAFLDETWKASSAILNALLTIINERVFDNGGQRKAVPLETMFGASNELPQDDALAPLYDRFLLRHEVIPVSDPLLLLDPRPAVSAKLVHLDVLQMASTYVKLPTEVRKWMLSLKNSVGVEGITIGDRRFQQSASLVRAAALLGGRGEATGADLWILAFCYWQTPDQIPTVRRIVGEAVTQSGHQPPPSPRTPPPPGRPPPPGTPPRGNVAHVATMPISDVYRSVTHRVRTQSTNANASDAELHTMIERLIRETYGAAAEQRQIQEWKRSLVAQATWLA